jgi:Na+/alanine symporter
MTPSYDDQLVVINLSLVFLSRTTIMYNHIYLFACVSFCCQRDISLCIHVLYIVGLVVLYT